MLGYYGFTYKQKKEWVCRHYEFIKLARNQLAKGLLMSVGLGISGKFYAAAEHGQDGISGIVLHVYLNHILKDIELLELIRMKEGYR